MLEGGEMSEFDVICSGVEKCRKLKNATHTIHYGDKEIVQRPEYCSGRCPHLPRPEEDSSHICPFINERVEGKPIWQRRAMK